MRSDQAVWTFLLCAMLGARADDTPTAATELSVAINTLKAHHINSDRVDWPTLQAQAQGMLGKGTAATDAYPAIRYVIAQLGEKHTFLITADRAKAMKADKPVGNAPAPRWVHQHQVVALGSPCTELGRFEQIIDGKRRIVEVVTRCIGTRLGYQRRIALNSEYAPGPARQRQCEINRARKKDRAGNRPPAEPITQRPLPPSMH